jgi:hypothetical protein
MTSNKQHEFKWLTDWLLHMQSALGQDITGRLTLSTVPHKAQAGADDSCANTTHHVNPWWWRPRQSLQHWHQLDICRRGFIALRRLSKLYILKKLKVFLYAAAQTVISGWMYTPLPVVQLHGFDDIALFFSILKVKLSITLTLHFFLSNLILGTD